MENNVELIKSLFVDIDPSIIYNDKLDIKDIPKGVIMYLKKLLKYTSGVKAFKTYHSIEKIYDERKQNKNNYKSDGLVDILDKQITSIMKAFLRLFKEDMRILSETDNKKLIK